MEEAERVRRGENVGERSRMERQNGEMEGKVLGGMR